MKDTIKPIRLSGHAQQQIRFRDVTEKTLHLAKGIAADYNQEGRLAGIEILDAMKRLGDAKVFKQVVLENVAWSHS